MKKTIIFLALLFTTLMLLTSAVCESFDFSSMSDEVLQKFISEANEELSRRSGNMYGKWFDYAIGQTLPNPDLVFGREAVGDTGIKVNDNTWFADEVENVTPEEYEAYIIACRLYGYNENEERSTAEYSSEDSDGNKLVLLYFGTTMMVQIN